jgi:hypothetical protein
MYVYICTGICVYINLFVYVIKNILIITYHGNRSISRGLESVYVYMYICMYVYIYIHIYICTGICVRMNFFV